MFHILLSLILVSIDMVSPNPFVQLIPISALPNLTISKNLPILRIQQSLISMTHCVLAERVQAVKGMHEWHCLRNAFLEMVECCSDD
jgi:hypothetical protein